MKKKTRVLGKKFFGYYKPYLGLFFADMACALIVAAISLVQPLIIRHITNNILVNYAVPEAVSAIVKLALVFVGLIAVEFACNFFITYKGHAMGAYMEHDLRNELFEHYQKLSFSFYNNQKTGQLMSRLTNDLFNITELIQETIRKSQVILNEEKIQIKFDDTEQRLVFADCFYIDQVFNNYFTNAIKNCDEIDGEKYIEISFKKKKNKLRVFVFNTGKNIAEEDMERIWRRFYKVDTSRNREKGGSGIGLSLVKAIMENYENKYGVENQYNGVEFYFDLDTLEKKETEQNK